VVGFNERALKFWKSPGFKKEGAERDEYYYTNEFSDCIMMSILEGEHEKTLLTRSKELQYEPHRSPPRHARWRVY
jgi:hypothetical protein